MAMKIYFLNLSAKCLKLITKVLLNLNIKLNKLILSFKLIPKKKVEQLLWTIVVYSKLMMILVK